MNAPTAVTAAVFAGAAAVLAGSGWYLYRTFDGLGVRALVGFAGTLWLAAVAGIGVSFVSTGSDLRLTLVVLLSALVWPASVWWVVFALEYTGRRRVLTRVRVAGAVAIAAVYLLFSSVEAAIELFDLQLGASAAVEVWTLVPPVVTIAATPVLIVFYLGSSALLVQASYRGPEQSTLDGLVFGGVGVILSIGPLIGFAIEDLLPYPLALLSIALPLLLVAGGLSVLAVHSGALRSTAVAAGTAARDRAFVDLADAAVVLDDEGEIVELNDAASGTFGVDRSAALGRQFDAVFDTSLPRVAEGSISVSADVEPDGGTTTMGAVSLDTVRGTRQFEVRSSRLDDGGGRQIGTILTFRDVTERELREQRIAILNRVLRHNLRNKLSIVRGAAELLPEEADENDLADRIERATGELLSLGEQARNVQALLDDTDHTPGAVAVRETVQRAVEGIQEEYPEAELRIEDVPDATVYTVDETFRFVVVELVENAVKHNDTDSPTVIVSGSLSEERLQIVVEDDGPGLPEQERIAINEHDESSLHHASGLGLWSVRWGVTSLGGTVRVEDAGPRGTIVTIDVPVDVTTDEEDA